MMICLGMDGLVINLNGCILILKMFLIPMCINCLITFCKEERQMHHNKIFILLWDTLVSCSL